MESRRTISAVVAVVLCLALVLGGQALTDASAAELGRADAGELIGGATSSYLTGLRTFAGAVLWNRLEPVMHGYYAGISLGEQRYMLSTIALVTTLDPHQVQAYSVGSWILADNDRVDDALRMSERGVDNNPNSGLALSNLAQMQYLYGEGAGASADTAKRALGDDVEWLDAVEKHQWYPILGDIFRQAGYNDLDAVVQQELERLDVESTHELGDVDHDHDHDGVPDH